MSYEMPDPARLVNPRGRVKDPADHPYWREHPVSAANVVTTYDAATASERERGMRWYADAHALAAAMTGGDAALGAILLACYSPQVPWPDTMLNAARSAIGGRALGPADGTMITRQTQVAAARALAGASLDTVLAGPKTLAFARLIALGGDAPDDRHGQVAVDRHALSVAAGHTITDSDRAPIGKPRMHEYAADCYRAGALWISHRDGITIAPHQVQAVAWLHQQATAEAMLVLRGLTAGTAAAGARGHGTAITRAWARWLAYAAACGLALAAGTTAL